MKECSKCKRCYDDDVAICPVDDQIPAFTIVGSTTLSGRYLLEQRLGQGGMGIVFRAKHKFLKSSHAIKVILPSLVDGDADLLVRFNQEAVLAASIDHPNVIRVTDFGVENDIMPFLVMEFIDGEPLSNYLEDGKPMSLDQAFGLFFPVAEGVLEAHSKGIVHRDLKPQNVMVQKNLPLRKAIKVLDFGLAKIKSADSYPSLIQAKTMNIVGSPPYMSPEQWSGDGVDHRTDIYALAVLLYQMLTGRLPFMGETMPAMMYLHLTVPPPTAESLGVSLAPEIEAIVTKALQKDRQNRYNSMDQMLRDLHDALGNAQPRSAKGVETEYLVPRTSLEGTVQSTGSPDQPLSDTQRERFYSYFDSKEKPNITADSQLAKTFLDAQDRIETAKTEAMDADFLIQELAEAEKEAARAQEKAAKAKERIEADVRRKVEAEMKRLAVEDQAKREAEAERLAQEVEARRVAEERANYLAQAALEAQQLAESERGKRQEEAQQRELQQGVREKAEIEAKRLAEQVAEATKQYEDARREAAREAQLRGELEARQKKIESDLESLTYNEAERRKFVESMAQKQIEAQAERFATEANAAKQRLDEARVLIDQEGQKREQAEAARVQAEKEAARLSQEIVEVHRQMQEMRQHITTSSGRALISGEGFDGNTPTRLTSSTRLSGGISSEVPPGLLNTSQTVRRKPFLMFLAVGLVSMALLAGGGIGLYFLFKPKPGPPAQPGNLSTPVSTASPQPAALIPRASFLLPAGEFLMGRNDIDDKENLFWGNQYPAHTEKVNSFYIDIYETTNAQYAEFVKDSGSKSPFYWVNNSPPNGLENFPVTNVSLRDAKLYATWISKREKKTCSVPT